MRLANKYIEDDHQRLLVHNEPVFEKLNQVGFDIALVDGIALMNDVYLVPHRLGIPWVSYVDLVYPVIIGVPMLPSFVQQVLSPYSDRMSFHRRLINTLVFLWLNCIKVTPDPPEEIQNRYRQYGSFDFIDDLMSRSRLWLATRDVVLDYPKPSMSNIIDIGGVTARPGNGKLTEELEVFVTDARSGVILVAFGSMVPSFPVPISEKLVSAFRRLSDFKIIWKFNDADGKLSIPDNVLLAKWLPQNDILADARVKLFITHCGNNRQFEAIYHGVPMIGFPLTGDQPYNAKRLEAKGFRSAMYLHSFTADELLANIRRVISDKSYKKRTTLA